MGSKARKNIAKIFPTLFYFEICGIEETPENKYASKSRA